MHASTMNKRKGFTLIELVVVIVLLGVLAVGVTGFMRMGATLFVETQSRTDMLATGRFVMERLNRELRTALSNSAKVEVNGSIQCITYLPIIEAVDYVNVPVVTDATSPSNTLSIVAVNAVELAANIVAGNNYNVAVSPTDMNQIYNVNSGIVQPLQKIAIAITGNQWDISFNNNIAFNSDSPTSRLYFIANQVSYCAFNQQLRRFVTNSPINADNPITFFNTNGVLMANNVANNHSPFTLNTAQARNATVQIELRLTEQDDTIVLNSEVHIPNAP